MIRADNDDYVNIDWFGADSLILFYLSVKLLVQNTATFRLSFRVQIMINFNDIKKLGIIMMNIDKYFNNMC